MKNIFFALLFILFSSNSYSQNTLSTKQKVEIATNKTCIQMYDFQTYALKLHLSETPGSSIHEKLSKKFDTDSTTKGNSFYTLYIKKEVYIEGVIKETSEMARKILPKYKNDKDFENDVIKTYKVIHESWCIPYFKEHFEKVFN